MPYKHYSPISRRVMDRTHFEGENTICQTIREMYHMTEDEPIRLKCRIAMSMAKAMCIKLSEYKQAYHEENISEYEDRI